MIINEQEYDNLRESSKFIGVMFVILAILISSILAIPMQSIGTEENNSMFGTITGIVIDEETDEPINYALMTLQYHDETHYTVTDSDGLYAFYKVPICFCLKNVSAEKTGYQSQFKYVPVNKITYVNFSLVPNKDPPKDEPDTDPEDPDEPGDPDNNDSIHGSIMGIVLDDKTNKPIQNCKMTLKYHNEFQIKYTDSDGSYTFEKVPMCFCLKNVSAQKDGYWEEYELVAVSQVTNVNFSLTPKDSSPDQDYPSDEPEDPEDPEEPQDGLYGTIYGTVLDADFKVPIENAIVVLKYHDKIRNTKTNSEGEFKFSYVPICFCLKNITVMKDYYKTQSKEIPVNETTMVYFLLNRTNGEVIPPQDLPPKSDDKQGRYTEDQLYSDLNGLGITIIGIVSILIILAITGGLFIVINRINHRNR